MLQQSWNIIKQNLGFYTGMMLTAIVVQILNSITSYYTHSILLSLAFSILILYLYASILYQTKQTVDTYLNSNGTPPADMFKIVNIFRTPPGTVLKIVATGLLSIFLPLIILIIVGIISYMLFSSIIATILIVGILSIILFSAIEPCQYYTAGGNPIFESLNKGFKTGIANFIKIIGVSILTMLGTIITLGIGSIILTPLQYAYLSLLTHEPKPTLTPTPTQMPTPRRYNPPQYSQ